MGNPLTLIRMAALLTAATITLVPRPGAAAEQHRLAFSKKLGVEIFAEGGVGGWCRETLQLRMVSANENIFKNKEISTLIRKLGKVIEAECPVANSANIKGFNAYTGDMVYQATASIEGSWLPNVPKPQKKFSDPTPLPQKDFSEPAPQKKFSDPTPLPQKEIKQPHKEQTPKQEERKGDQPAYIFIVLAAAAFLGAVVIFFAYRRRRKKSTVPPTPSPVVDVAANSKTSPAIAADASATPHITATPADELKEEDTELPALQAAFEAYDDGDYATALAVFIEHAENNIAAAQFALGFAYEQGKGVEQNDTEAANWYRKAAEQGMDMAQRELGSAYENGRGVSKDINEAVEWYRKAAEGGDAEAQLFLGMMYVGGEGVQHDDVEALKWYRKAAEQGLAEAQWALGSGYESGEGVPQNNNEAASWYRKAAEQEYALAQLDLGRMYLSGHGVPQDSAEGASLILKAAEQKEPEAQTILSSLYEEGIGVTQDQTEALKWLQLAAEGEEVEAQLQLGLKYHGGKWIAQDYSQSSIWFLKAADQGNASAQTMLGFAYELGEGVAEDQEKAFNWFHKAAEQGEAEAQFNVGTRFHEGRGVQQNNDEAHKWLSLAASQGHEDSAAALEELRKSMSALDNANAQGLEADHAASDETSDLDQTNRAISSKDEPLYEDSYCRITYSILELGGTTYPVSKIASVMQPLQLPFEIFGGFLLNGALFVVGLAGILSFELGIMFMGLIAAAIGGFNVYGQFHRPWWITVTLANHEEVRIQKSKKDEIDSIYLALRKVIEV